MLNMLYTVDKICFPTHPLWLIIQAENVLARVTLAKDALPTPFGC